MSENPIDVPAVRSGPAGGASSTVNGENSRANVQNVRGDSSASRKGRLTARGWAPSSIGATSLSRRHVTGATGLLRGHLV